MATTHLFSVLAIALVLVSSGSVLAQERGVLDPVPFADGKVPDHMKTMVIGTRFVRNAQLQSSPGEQFKNSRVPLSEFNATDHCIDTAALEIAEAYFRTLGRMLERTGYYYHIPPGDTDRLKADCRSRHHAEPEALAVNGTKIIAFGQVVPTKHAPALEKTLR